MIFQPHSTGLPFGGFQPTGNVQPFGDIGTSRINQQGGGSPQASSGGIPSPPPGRTALGDVSRVQPRIPGLPQIGGGGLARGETPVFQPSGGGQANTGAPSPGPGGNFRGFQPVGNVQPFGDIGRARINQRLNQPKPAGASPGSGSPTGIQPVTPGQNPRPFADTPGVRTPQSQPMAAAPQPGIYEPGQGAAQGGNMGGGPRGVPGLNSPPTGPRFGQGTNPPPAPQPGQGQNYPYPWAPYGGGMGGGMPGGISGPPQYMTGPDPIGHPGLMPVGGLPPGWGQPKPPGPAGSMPPPAPPTPGPPPYIWNMR